MSYVIANIGSNLGNRRLNISRAVRALEEAFGYFELSHVVETKPWGFESDKPFLNVGIAFHTDLTPREVLHKFKEIEQRISPAPHRHPDGSYADRLIDIDIMAIDEEVIDEEDLKVPHPHLAKRRFFLEPLNELAPGWVHPRLHLSPAEMLSALPAEKDEKPENPGTPE